MLEDLFLFFPDTNLRETPAVASLAYRDIFFTAADGTRLHGWFLEGDQGKPPVLFCHGNAGNISDRIESLVFLRRMGLSVFIFDYRGYGHSNGCTSEEGTYLDARAALTFLEDHGWTARQVIFLGHSLGAAVALQLALEESPAALVLESPFTSIPAMGRVHYPIISRLFGWLFNPRYDNLSKIGRVRAPLWIIHGLADTVVPPAMGEALIAAAQPPKHLLLLPGCGHNDHFIACSELYRDVWRILTDDTTL